MTKEDLKVVKNIQDDVSGEMLDYYLNMDKQDIALYYKGPFDEVILSKISQHLRSKFPESPKASKKLFAIFIELAQNIAFYSAEKYHFDEKERTHGIGTILVKDSVGKITFTCGNLVDNKSVLELINKCEHINSLNYDELRELRKEIRNAPRKENHKGGNIGLVQVALKSENPLTTKAIEIDNDHSFFLLSTEIEK